MCLAHLHNYINYSYGKRHCIYLVLSQHSSNHGLLTQFFRVAKLDRRARICIVTFSQYVIFAQQTVHGRGQQHPIQDTLNDKRSASKIQRLHFTLHMTKYVLYLYAVFHVRAIQKLTELLSRQPLVNNTDNTNPIQ